LSDPTRQYYDALADIYDEACAKYDVNGEFVGELSKINHPVKSVLDLGCGTGQTIAAVRSHYTDADITAVDVSENMLTKAKEKFANVRFFRQDMTPFVDGLSNYYDLISSISALEFVPNLPEFVRRLLRHLRRPGTCIITYEPLIARSRAQSKANDLLNGASIHADAMFPIYRWDSLQINAAVTAVGATIASSRLYVAYERQGEPVIYHLLRIVSSGGS
jgi:ubiquinone/menaquinone biosynthesis C-methylase UbiE